MDNFSSNSGLFVIIAVSGSMVLLTLVHICKTCVCKKNEPAVQSSNNQNTSQDQRQVYGQPHQAQRTQRQSNSLYSITSGKFDQDLPAYEEIIKKAEKEPNIYEFPVEIEEECSNSLFSHSENKQPPPDYDAED